jgi:hypothetical protein
MFKENLKGTFDPVLDYARSIEDAVCRVRVCAFSLQ